MKVLLVCLFLANWQTVRAEESLSAETTHSLDNRGSSIETSTSDAKCSRIISLAPSITELVIALQLADKLVGVSSFDNVLSSDSDLPRVGDLFNVNLETALSLRPSIVLALHEQRHLIKKVESVGIKSVIFNHNTLEGIQQSIEELGTLCHVHQNSDQLLSDLTREMASVKDSLADQKVLIVIGGVQEQLYVSGRDGFFYPLLKHVGLKPAFEQKTVATGALAAEALLSLRPDHILHILPPNRPLPSKEVLKTHWRKFAGVPAVQRESIFVRSEPFFSIPGIHYPKVAKAFVEMFGELNERDPS